MNTTIDIKTKIAKCCEQGSKRYALEGACITGSGNRAVVVATDGRALVALPVDAEGEPLEQIFEAAGSRQACVVVPTEVLPTSIKKQEKSRPKLTLNGRAECGGKHGDYVEGRYPSVGKIIDMDIEKCNTVGVAIDAQILLNIAQALNGPNAEKQSVMLLFNRETITNGPIRVLANNDVDDIRAVAVVMPLAMDTIRTTPADSCRNAHEQWQANAKEILDRLPASMK